MVAHKLPKPTGDAMIDTKDIVAILLAAGASSRFGADDKLLAPVAGEALVLHAARHIIELEPRRAIAVCRASDGAVAAALSALGFEIVVNPATERGLSQSLRRGIDEAARGPETAALICLADMPFIRVSHLRNLLARFDALDAPVVGSTNGQAAMPPALFARSQFDRLRIARGDRGGKALLADAALIHASADELADIDRPKDLDYD